MCSSDASREGRASRFEAEDENVLLTESIPTVTSLKRTISSVRVNRTTVRNDFHVCSADSYEDNLNQLLLFPDLSPSRGNYSV